jgi:hypothetical protein
MDRHECIAAALNCLPSYAEVDIVCVPYEGARPNQFRLMARDRPTYDKDLSRRFTNLTTGTEWFVKAEALEAFGVVSVEIHFDDVKDFWSIT